MRAKLLRIAKLERRIAALQADQAELTASFVDERLRFDEDHGYPSDPAQYRAMVAEVAIAKRVSVITAGTFMDDAVGPGPSQPVDVDGFADRPARTVGSAGHRPGDECVVRPRDAFAGRPCPG